MKKTNPFVEFIDRMLLADREHYITKRDILEAYENRTFRNDAKYRESIKTSKFYNSMQDGIGVIRDELKRMHSVDFELKGTDLGSGFRYPMGIADPISNLKSDHKQMRAKQLQRMIDASVGLFPTTWLADLLVGAQSMAKDKGKCISFDQNVLLEHIQWVPTFFDAIEDPKILKFGYNANYSNLVELILFHPWYIKEYNQRWFVFGYSTDADGTPLQYNTIAIDRIVGEVETVGPADKNDPKRKAFDPKRFDDVVGVTRPHNKKRLLIEIATRDAKTHGRIRTKPLKENRQTEVCAFDEKGDGRGRFLLKVIPNDELDALLMSFGAGIEIVGPEEYRDRFAQKVRTLCGIYPKSDLED